MSIAPAVRSARGKAKNSSVSIIAEPVLILGRSC
jgi:hypothetical protein